jgi:hypothetical protein
MGAALRLLGQGQQRNLKESCLPEQELQFRNLILQLSTFAIWALIHEMSNFRYCFPFQSSVVLTPSRGTIFFRVTLDKLL